MRKSEIIFVFNSDIFLSPHLNGDAILICYGHQYMISVCKKKYVK